MEETGCASRGYCAAQVSCCGAGVECLCVLALSGRGAGRKPGLLGSAPGQARRTLQQYSARSFIATLTPTSSASRSPSSRPNTTSTVWPWTASSHCATRLATPQPSREFALKSSSPPWTWNSARARARWYISSPRACPPIINPPPLHTHTHNTHPHHPLLFVSLPTPQPQMHIDKVNFNCKMPASLSNVFEPANAGDSEFMLIRDVFAVAMHLVTSLAVWPHMVRGRRKFSCTSPRATLLSFAPMCRCCCCVTRWLPHPPPPHSPAHSLSLLTSPRCGTRPRSSVIAERGFIGTLSTEGRTRRQLDCFPATSETTRFVDLFCSRTRPGCFAGDPARLALLLLR